MTTTQTNEMMPSAWQYQSERVVLVPYVEGNPIFGPDILVRIWAMLERDGLMEKVFAGAGEMTLNKTVAYLSKMPLLIGLVKPMRGSPDSMRPEIAGMAWLWGVEGTDYKKAMIGMAFFKPFWRTPEIRELSRMALHWWFYELKVNVLFGTIRATNGIAVSFGKKLGFRKVARVPNWYCEKDGYQDAFLVTLTKDQFLETLAAGGRL